MPDAEITLTLYGEDGTELESLSRYHYGSHKDRVDRKLQRLAAAINAGKVTAKVTSTTTVTEELPEVEYAEPQLEPVKKGHTMPTTAADRRKAQLDAYEAQHGPVTRDDRAPVTALSSPSHEGGAPAPPEGER